jgi:hypothetical protein
VSGIGDLIGSGGFIEQMLLWGVVNQVVSSLAAPALLVLQQDIAAGHPEVVIDPETAAALVARQLMTLAAAETEAARSGVDGDRFALLNDLAKVRIAPADLATAVLRDYITLEQAQAQALPQGYSADDFGVMVDLAGDAPGPQQLAEALRRGIIDASGTGPNSTSFVQGIAESRLRNKWAPMIDALSQQLLSAPDAADAVIRNFLSLADGEKLASEQGIDAATFAVMTHLAGDAPGPQQLAEALRRGAIPEAGTGADATSFEQGIAEGRLADKWTPVIKALSMLWPTPVDALNATLKGQVTLEQGQALYVQLGGDPQFFQVLYDTQGEAPSPLELIAMANRGYVPWDGLGADVVSYQQGFHEGHWRNKWEPVYQKFAAYLPPPGEIAHFLEQGSITAEQAAAYFAQHGMDETIIAAQLESAHLAALSQYRGLSVGTAIDAYRAQVITAGQASDILASLHVLPDAITLLLEYADFQRTYAQVNNAVTRIRSLYTTRKITLDTARDSLTTLGIPAQTIPDMLAVWSLEFGVEVKTLSGEQVALAFLYGAFTQAQAQQELVNIGYTPLDSYALLCAYSKSTLPDPPAAGPPPPVAGAIPGLT